MRAPVTSRRLGQMLKATNCDAEPICMSDIPSDSSGTPPKPANPNNESEQYIRLGDLPQSFLDKVMYEFAPYSIGLARVRDELLETFSPIGSGAFVKRGGRYGILTARHCTHECCPQLSIGSHGRDSLYICLRNGRTARLAPNILFRSDYFKKCSKIRIQSYFLKIKNSKKISKCLYIYQYTFF